jgi:hypothetical protein
VEIDITTQQVAEGVNVRVAVRLSSREMNRLFLSGDTLVQLPIDGLTASADQSPIPRTSIFLSELAGSKDGLSRAFVDPGSAEAFAAAVRDQLETILEEL